MDMTGNFIALMISQSDYRSGEKYSSGEEKEQFACHRLAT